MIEKLQITVGVGIVILALVAGYKDHGPLGLMILPAMIAIILVPVHFPKVTAAGILIAGWLLVAYWSMPMAIVLGICSILSVIVTKLEDKIHDEEV